MVASHIIGTYPDPTNCAVASANPAGLFVVAHAVRFGQVRWHGGHSHVFPPMHPAVPGLRSLSKPCVHHYERAACNAEIVVAPFPIKGGERRKILKLSGYLQNAPLGTAE